MRYNLAQINIAKMQAPIDSQIMSGFVSNLDIINALADTSEGFIWRLISDNPASIKIFDDDFLIVNMSVWKDMETLFRFVYQSPHVEIFKRRREWFEKMPDMHMALWYIPTEYIPSVSDATERLVYLRKNGETPYAFSFKKRFTINEAEIFIPS